MASKITYEKTERKGRKLLASVEDDLAEWGTLGQQLYSQFRLRIMFKHLDLYITALVLYKYIHKIVQRLEDS